jgi:hypothetical protein
MRFAIVLVLGGCASMDPEGCRRANWYDIGFRDALFGIQRQDDLYTLQCDPHGYKVDVVRYSQGWREGYWEAETRKSGSHE